MYKLQDSKNVVILGAGGHAHVIADIIFACGDKVVAFLDDDTNVADCNGSISDYNRYKDVEFVIGIGNPDIRENLADRLCVKWYTAIHPSAVISPSAVVGEGTVIMPNAVVNARTVIGNHCIINSGAIVEHDNVLKDFVHISVGAKLGGSVSVGRKSWVGIGASVKNDLSICDNCMLGAGAVIVSSVTESGVYMGVPARKFR